MVLVALKEKGIIKVGMRFVLLRETESSYECWSVELELNFKISKKLIGEVFEIREYRQYKWKKKPRM